MTFKTFILIGAFTLLYSFKGNAQSNAEMKSFDPTFVHTVFFWLHNPDSPDDRSAFETSLKRFLNRSQYAKTKFIGTAPVATREVVDGSFTYSLVLSFESAEAQDAYQQEQPHLDFISEVSHLWKKVIVYDSMGIPE